MKTNKISENNEKLLSIIIPVFGKGPKQTFSNIKKIINKLKNEDINKIEFIIVYKNSIKLNYDLLNRLTKNKNVFVFKMKNNVLRTAKVLKGINDSNSKFSIIMDAHHSIDCSEINSFLKYIENSNDDLIFTIPKEYNVDTKKSFFREYDSVTAGRYAVKTSLAKRAIEDLGYDIVFHDDWTVGIAVLSYEKNPNISWYKNSFYIKNHGNSISNTFGNLDLTNLKRMIEDSSKILNYFIEKNDNKNSEFFINQFSMLFNGYIRRKKIVNNINEISSKSIHAIIEGLNPELILNYKNFINNDDKNEYVKEIFDILNSKKLSFNNDVDSIKQKKINVVFCFDNNEQKYFFKKAISTITYKKNIILNIFYPKGFLSIDSKEDLNLFIENEGFINKANFFEIDGNGIFDKHAKFYWMRAPFFLSEKTERMLIFDNDLSFNKCNFDDLISLSQVNENSSNILAWGVPVNNISNHPYKKKAFDLLTSQDFIRNNIKNYINFGVAIINVKLWKKLFISIENILKIGNERLNFFVDNKLFLSDQDFLWTLHGDKFGFIPGKYNIKLHSLNNKLLSNKQEWILHYNLWNDFFVKKFNFEKMFKNIEQSTSQIEFELAFEECVEFYLEKIRIDRKEKPIKNEVETFRNKLYLLVDSFIKKEFSFISFVNQHQTSSFISHFNSIKKNFGWNRFDYYLGLTEEAFELIKGFIINNNIKYKIINNKKNDKISTGPNQVSNLTFERLFMYSHFPELFFIEQTLIYIDPDTSVLDIKELSKYKKENFAFVNNITFPTQESVESWSATLEGTEFQEKIMNMLLNRNYFNSGVMIINNHILLHSLLKKIRNDKKWFTLDVQMLLNFYNDEEIKTIDDVSFNLQVNQDIIENPKIINYSGQQKPWYLKNEIDLCYVKYFRIFNNVNDSLVNSFIENTNFNKYLIVISSNYLKYNSNISLSDVCKNTNKNIEFIKEKEFRKKKYNEEKMNIFLVLIAGSVWGEKVENTIRIKRFWKNKK